MILNGNDKVGHAKVYATALEMKQAEKINSLTKQNEMLIEAIDYAIDEKHWGYSDYGRKLKEAKRKIETMKEEK